MNELQKLAFDLYNGSVEQNFSKADTNTVLRKAFMEVIGTDEIDAKTLRRNQTEIFEILEDTIAPILNDRLEEQMGAFAEVHNLALGDTVVFDIEDPNLFQVANIADGTHNLRKQRIDNGKLTVDMGTYGVAIYEELLRFLSGRADWGKLVDKVIKSYERKIAEDVQKALFDGYSAIVTEFKYTGSYDESQLLRVLGNLESHYGSAMIVGTKAALAKIQPNYVGDIDKAQYNALGRLGHFRGYPMVELAQTFKAGTFTNNLSNNDLLILPASESKFVKIVTEGSPHIIDNTNMNGDGSIEHTFIQKVGVAVALAKHYGIVRFTS